MGACSPADDRDEARARQAPRPLPGGARRRAEERNRDDEAQAAGSGRDACRDGTETSGAGCSDGVACGRREDLRHRRRPGRRDDRRGAPRGARRDRGRPRPGPARRRSPTLRRRDVEGERGQPRALADAGVRDADLVIACTSRDEANIVAGTFARLEAPRATTMIRTSNVEYVELWREGQLDVDFVVSSELETAHAIARVDRHARGAADRHLRRRRGADRRVRRRPRARAATIVGTPLRECAIPAGLAGRRHHPRRRDDASARRRR